MESSVNFIFRDQQYAAKYTICEREYPTYIYVTLAGKELVAEFGDEIVLHTTGTRLLVDHVYTPHRLELYITIFDAIAASEGGLTENTSYNTRSKFHNNEHTTNRDSKVF